MIGKEKLAIGASTTHNSTTLPTVMLGREEGKERERYEVSSARNLQNLATNGTCIYMSTHAVILVVYTVHNNYRVIPFC